MVVVATVVAVEGMAGTWLELCGGSVVVVVVVAVAAVVIVDVVIVCAC